MIGIKTIFDSLLYILFVIVIGFLYNSYGISDNLIFFEFIVSSVILVATIKTYFRYYSFALFPIYNILLYITYVFPVIYLGHLEETWVFNTVSLKETYSSDAVENIIFMMIVVQIITFFMLVTFRLYSTKCYMNDTIKYKIKKNGLVLLTSITLSLIFVETTVDPMILPSFLQQFYIQVTEFIYIPIGIMLFQYLNYRDKRSKNILYLLLLFYGLLLILKAAAAPFMELGLFILFLLYHKGIKIHWSIYVYAGIFIAFIMNFKMSIRMLFWDGKEYSFLEKLTGVIQLFGNLFTSGNDVFQASLDFLLGRSQMLTTFIIAYVKTPADVAYWEFSQLQHIFWGFIPRIIFPFKPEVTEGQVFGHAYNMLSESDLTTAVNVPSIIGFYIAFGIVSLIAGAFLFNLIMLKISALAASRSSDEPMIITLAYFSFHFIHTLDTGYTGIGLLFYKTLIIYIVTKYIYKRIMFEVVEK